MVKGHSVSINSESDTFKLNQTLLMKLGHNIHSNIYQYLEYTNPIYMDLSPITLGIARHMKIEMVVDVLKM